MTTVPLRWRKSTYSSTQSACVEMAEDSDGVLLRNSIHPDAGTLSVQPDAMAAWVATVAAGDIDDLAG